MFRKMRRSNQQLTDSECTEILINEPRGIMAVHGEDGYPYAFPMDYVYIDGKLYFHCAKDGHKIDAISNDNRVSFCVMDKGFKKDGDWALNIKSVIIFGKIRTVENAGDITEIARNLGLKYYPTAEEVEVEIEKAISRVRILELTIDHMTGKLVNES